MSLSRRTLFLFVGLLATGAAKVAYAKAPASSPEERAVAYLAVHTPTWPQENGCFSCHNNGDAARALWQAKRSGFAVPEPALVETTAWLLAPDRWADNKGRPEFSDQRLADLQFSWALVATIDGGTTDGDEALAQAARRVAASQADDGAWRFDISGAVGSPITYGPFLATVAGRQVLTRANPATYANQIASADRWLRTTPAMRVLDAAAAIQGLASATDEPAVEQRRQCLKLILSGQAADGGFGPYVSSPPEPFDTAIVVLALAAIPEEAAATPRRRGREFLIASQLDDGSWPATTRPPGGESYPQKISTTAWATLALLATISKQPASSKQPAGPSIRRRGDEHDDDQSE